MNVNLYLHENDFAYNGVDGEDELKHRFKHLVKDLSEINGRDDVTLYRSKDLTETKVYKDTDILEFAKKAMDSDEIYLFYMFWDQEVQEFSMSIDELVKMTHYAEKEEVCNARVVLNEEQSKKKDNENDEAEDRNKDYMQFDQYEVIYNRGSWTTLRRQILGNHPGDAASFVAECKDCFDNLKFGDVCVRNMEGAVEECPRRIVYYLSCINDCFLDFVRNHPHNKSPKAYLADFAGRYRMDKAGSPQNDPKEKAKYTFVFSEDDKRYVCDAHFKIQHPDDGKAREIARIYVYYGSADKLENKVWIGSMGKYHA